MVSADAAGGWATGLVMMRASWCRSGEDTELREFNLENDEVRHF